MADYRPQASDTSEAVDRRVMQGFAAMTPLERLQLAVQWTRALHRLSVAGLRLRHPELSEEELERRAGALRLGKDLTLRTFGPEAEAWFDE